MATVVNKDFKVKHGLIVEGTTGTIDGNDILTKNIDSDNYIIDLIGGETLVTSVSGNLSVTNGDLTINETGLADSLTTDSNFLYDDGSGNIMLDNEGVYDDLVAGGLATQTYVTDAIGNIDLTFNTDEISEGQTNLYYTNTRVDNHLTGGDGITYSSGTISADVAGGLHISGGQVQINRDTVDGWYDAAGTAATEAGYVATDLSIHEGLSSGVHGVTGSVVGTSDEQTLSNKDFNGSTVFHAANGAGSLEIDLNTSSGAATITNNNDDLTITTNGGDIVINASGTAYIDSASAGNEIATNAYVDNAVAGLNWKQAVNLLYDDSTPTLSGDSVTTPLVIDQHPALGAGEVGYRILVKNGNDAGIYVYNQTGTSWTLDRAADADTYEELVGAAVFVMEGTQYDQTSWVQSNHYLSAFTGQSWTQFSGTGSVVAGSGITVDGLEVSIDRTTVDTWYDASGTAADLIDDHDVASGVHGVSGNVVGTTDSQTLTNKTIDASDNTISNIANSSLTNSSIDINGYNTSLGGTVTLDTDDVAEGSAQYFTQARARGSVSAGNGINYDSNTGVIDANLADFDTDNLSEGSSNLYYTDGRAKSAAADLLTNATKTNITITGNGSGLTITAEDGFDGHDTDDLPEGSSHLYFTDERAVSALEAVTPNFTEIDINSLAKQVAAEVANITTASTVTAYAFAKADYRSAKFLVKTAYGSHTEVSEVLLTLDSSDNVAITEYAIVGTNGSSMNVSADVDGSNVRLRVQTLNSNSTVTVVGTLLA